MNRPFRIALLAVACILITATGIHAQLISECSPTPGAGEPEWVELHNTSAREMNLAGWMLCDSRTCVRLPVLRIPAHGYAVVTRDTVALAECRNVDGITMAEASLPSLNNTTDVVVLRRPDATMADSIAYDVRRLARGRSVERTGLWVADNIRYDERTVAASRSTDSATCGYLNSTVRLYRDLAVSGWHASGTGLVVTVENEGQQAMPACTLHIHVAGNERTYAIPSTQPNERLETDIDYTNIVAWQSVVAWTDADDDRPRNDTLMADVEFPPAPAVATITEVMFDPFPSQGDYVEIANTTADTVRIGGWHLTDTDGQTMTLPADAMLLPYAYLVVAMDSLVLSMVDDSLRYRVIIPARGLGLDASGDAVALKTSSGFLVDSVAFGAHMHIRALPTTRGVSLEKLDPLLSGMSAGSWSSSGELEGGSPARANSVRLHPLTQSGVAVAPAPCSADPADFRYPCAIRFELPFRHATVGIRILTVDARHVAWLLNTRITGSLVLLVWTGTDDSGQRMPHGPYLVHVECVDATSGRVHRDMAVLVLGGP